MGLSSLNFIISQFEAEKYRYFAIYDDDGDTVLLQNELIDTGTALQKLRSFLKENQGQYTIKVFGKKLTNPNNLISRDNSTIAKYTVDIEKQALPNGVSGLAGMPSSPVSSFLPADDPRNGAPNMFQLLGQLSGVEQQMKLMEKDHQHYREIKALEDKIQRMEEESKKAKGMGAIVDRLGQQFSDPAVILGLISGVSQMFQKTQQQPQQSINGIDMQVKNEVENASKSINQSITTLMRIDPQFVENLEKLATLATKNPQLYQLAINQLKSL